MISTEPQFSDLPQYQERSFVPKDADLGDKEQIIALYENLLNRDIESAQSLENWILNRSEMESAVDQKRAILYIRMTCQTDDKARADEYKHFVETIVPVLKVYDDKLNRKYLLSLKKCPVSSGRYEIYNRSIQSDIDLFVEENVSLETEVALMSQEYQAISGAMTVEFQGKERTLPEMGKFLIETDRNLRESAWRASAERRLKEQKKLDDLFDKMLSVRDRIARNAGCGNYCEYQFKAYHRFDYTSEDCKVYHKTVEKCVVPVWADILKKRKRDMGIDKLRPWDTGVDPKGRGPLKPFEKVDELLSGVGKIFHKVDPELGLQFQEMADLGLLDLDSRKGKAPGGYQSTLSEVRKPFIFMNAVGVNGDVNTLLHEGGHAFHSLACAHDPLLDYRHGPMEFNEVASMGMELLAGEHLDVFYNEEDKLRSRREHFEDIVHVLAWVATIDAFQHWIYENPRHTQDDRAKAWIEIFDRFSGGVVDWSGLEIIQKALWHRQLHIFEVPFYYIEYGIAQLGALQLWTNAKKDYPKALADYRKGLSLGGSRPLPEIYTTAGLKFDFSERTMVPLIDAVKSELIKV